MSCPVVVARKDLIDALRPLPRIVRKKDYDSPAVVSMDGGTRRTGWSEPG